MSKKQQLAEQLIPSIRRQWELRIQQLQAIQALPTLADIPPLYQAIPKTLDSKLIEYLVETRTLSWGYSDHNERSLGYSDEDIGEQQAHAQQAIAALFQVVLKGANASSWLNCVEEALDWADSCG